MDINLVLGILGVALSLISLAYAVYVTFKSRREKRLLYDVTPTAALVDAVPRDSNHAIKIVYERPGLPSETVDGVFVQFVRFTNFGRVPIRKEDLAYNDPLRIEAKGGKILDISLVRVARDVCRIKLSPAKEEGDRSVVNLDFDFLDYMDGGLIQIASDSIDTSVIMSGTIVEMPSGIKQGGPRSYSMSVEGPAAALLLATWAAVLVATPLVFRIVMGSWNNVWLMFLPILSLAFPIIVLIITATVLGIGRREPKYPGALNLPPWFRPIGLPPSRRLRR